MIVLDVMLPGLDGFEVAAGFASEERAPVLMLTARDAVDDRVNGLDAGADDYLTKPFAFDELVARLRRSLRRGAIERALVLKVGDLALDPTDERVWRDDDEVDLSAKEFALLETFMRHPGQVLSRFELLEHAWDFATRTARTSSTSTCATSGEARRPATIETVRGAGYRLAGGGMRRLPIRLRLTLAFAAAMALCSPRPAPSCTSASARASTRRSTAGSGEGERPLALVRQSGGLGDAGRDVGEPGDHFAQVLRTDGTIVDATPDVRGTLLTHAEVARAAAVRCLVDPVGSPPPSTTLHGSSRCLWPPTAGHACSSWAPPRTRGARRSKGSSRS